MVALCSTGYTSNVLWTAENLETGLRIVVSVIEKTDSVPLPIDVIADLHDLALSVAGNSISKLDGGSIG